MGLVFREWAAFIARETNATEPFCLFQSNIADQKEVVVLHVTLHQRSKYSLHVCHIKRMEDEKEGTTYLTSFLKAFHKLRDLCSSKEVLYNIY